MSGAWYDLVPNVGKEREDDPDITDTGIFSEILPAVGQLFKLLAPYRRDKTLVRDSHGDEVPGTSKRCDNDKQLPKADEVSKDVANTPKFNAGKILTAILCYRVVVAPSSR